MKKNILIFYLFLLSLSYADSSIKDTKFKKISYEGKYSWDKNNDKQVFTIEIVRKGNVFIGQYCGTYLSGKIIDCSDEDEPSFQFNLPIEKNAVIVEFLSYYGYAKGKVKLTFGEEKLLWEIVEKPKSIFYCPTNAVLIRHTTHVLNIKGKRQFSPLFLKVGNSIRWGATAFN
jgi:hypothetical protein